MTLVQMVHKPSNTFRPNTHVMCYNDVKIPDSRTA